MVPRATLGQAWSPGTLCCTTHNLPGSLVASNKSAHSFQFHSLAGRFCSTQHWLGLHTKHSFQCREMAVTRAANMVTSLKCLAPLAPGLKQSRTLRASLPLPLCLLSPRPFSLHAASLASTVARSLYTTASHQENRSLSCHGVTFIITL